MKALLTGCTARQTGGRTQLNYIDPQDCYHWCLEQLGYEVERRRVTPGEDLDGYSVIINSLSPAASLGSGYIFGSLWAMHTRPDCLLAVEDWRCCDILGHVRGAMCKKHQVHGTYHGFDGPLGKQRNGFDVVMGDPTLRKQIMNVCEMMATKTWPFKLLVPTFDGGDMTSLNLPAKELVRFLYGNFYRNKYQSLIVSNKNRKKQWVQASLSDVADRWIDKMEKKGGKLSWPIVRAGCRKLGQPRMDEQDIFNLYCQNWGVLSAPYKHLNSGWYRVRFQLAVDAGAVFACDEREVEMWCGARPLHPREIEALSDKQLSELHELQLQAVNEALPSKEDLVRIMKGAIE